MIERRLPTGHYIRYYGQLLLAISRTRVPSLYICTQQVRHIFTYLYYKIKKIIQIHIQIHSVYMKIYLECMRKLMVVARKLSVSIFHLNMFIIYVFFGSYNSFSRFRMGFLPHEASLPLRTKGMKT